MVLKIVYPVCCGIDVHKSFAVACIAATNDKGVTTYKQRRFSTFTGDLRLLAGWLADNYCQDVCMESTGKYWLPVYNIFESTCKVLFCFQATFNCGLFFYASKDSCYLCVSNFFFKIHIL